MTNRECMLAILDGKPPDRIPWIPRLKIWYEANKLSGTLPPEYRGKSLRQIERDVFGGTAGRDGAVWQSEIRDVEIRTCRLGNMETMTEYITPVGTVNTQFRGTEQSRGQGLPDTQVGFLLSSRDDYPIVEYIVEHTHFIPTFEQYERYEQEIGEEAYPLVRTGDCPFHYWMQGLAGYEQAFFHLNDFPDRVEHLLTVITERYKETIWTHMLDCPARLFQHGVHLSSQMTPPPLFDKYITPYYKQLVPPLRARGKVVALHADSDTQAIFSEIEQAGFGMAECLATSPLVPTTLADARAAWGDRVIIWGGVPSVILEGPYTDEQFEQHMDEMFRTIAPGKAFILGIADNAMPTSKIERIRRITEIVRQRGTYPLQG